MANEPIFQKLTSKWLGAAFYWLLKGFAGKYSEQLKPEYKHRNIWTGYIINLLVFGALVYFCVIEK
ncbi:hypothetical protein [Pinibacter aurantiacus]|uniref:Uncharacterized protein n=1 Tax=Pinibacter aurantiacus TaxID=2851599 RepID=A0A9E2SAJ1_9BACT|nr:hypothetical protein [Pinibacter aurantiacus]MBV4358617.1 hypothetical protein [Pinibacter aurantiacus]